MILASDSLVGMPQLSYPLRFVLVALAGRINQQQRTSSTISRSRTAEGCTVKFLGIAA
jgi:hypothetical protein